MPGLCDKDKPEYKALQSFLITCEKYRTLDMDRKTKEFAEAILHCDIRIIYLFDPAAALALSSEINFRLIQIGEVLADRRKEKEINSDPSSPYLDTVPSFYRTIDFMLPTSRWSRDIKYIGKYIDRLLDGEFGYGNDAAGGMENIFTLEDDV